MKTLTQLLAACNAALLISRINLTQLKPLTCVDLLTEVTEDKLNCWLRQIPENPDR